MIQGLINYNNGQTTVRKTWRISKLIYLLILRYDTVSHSLVARCVTVSRRASNNASRNDDVSTRVCATASERALVING